MIALYNNKEKNVVICDGNFSTRFLLFVGGKKISLAVVSQYFHNPTTNQLFQNDDVIKVKVRCPPSIHSPSIDPFSIATPQAYR
jgi:hypothetical protein